MAQIKIYGHANYINTQRQTISDEIHRVAMQVLGLPEHKRFQRFFPMQAQDFFHPVDRSTNYLILEIHLFQGRKPEPSRRLIRGLQFGLQERLALSPTDLEITVIETPPTHWGIRGQLGNELQLSYEVNQ